MQVLFKRLRANAVIPRREHESDAGLDLTACERCEIAPRGGRALVPTGLALEMSYSLEAQVRPRSGLALKFGVTVLNSPGTIDAGYRGEIGVILINHGDSPFIVEEGMRIAQLVFANVARPEIAESAALSETDRGVGGFGSTGNKN